MRSVYLRDARPWVVAFSGGKDSTLVLQLVCAMLQGLDSAPPKPVFVISCDTRVEAPNIIDYLQETLRRIDSWATSSGLPVTTHLVSPEPDESFWGKLIGKGYPSPTRWFRWCTTSMKIKPTRRLIEKITTEWGSVVLLLGTRSAESPSRSQRIQQRETTVAGLNPHHEIPDALVATPIVEWSDTEVWSFLRNNDPPPWGGTHEYLIDLYRQAGGSECPLVLDLGTPSCGGNRLGCWTCTVVKLDRSMTGFVESGETWMAPLLHFRNWLKAIREDPEWRMLRRRDGTKDPSRRGPMKRSAIFKGMDTGIRSC